MAEMTRTRMTAKEFLELPESNMPIELINGEIIMSPTPKDPHQDIVLSIAILLKPMVTAGKVKVAPMDVHFDDVNVVQPDVFWAGGEGSRCQLGDDGYWHGAPDLVVEVLSPSTSSHDRGVKYDLYEKYGVREYWLVEPDAKYIEIYVLQEGKFVRQGLFEPGASFTSLVIEGQSVAVDKLFEY